MYKHGQDVRFDEIKINPKTFAGAFTGQATWIMVSGLPFWLVNTIPVGHHPRFGTISDLSGVAVWIVGFTVEVLADHRASMWHRFAEIMSHRIRFANRESDLEKQQRCETTRRKVHYQRAVELESSSEVSHRAAVVSSIYSLGDIF
jgi:hypothetical protein